MTSRGNPALMRGTLVRTMREYMGLTRNDLAGALGVSFDSVRSWEGDRRGTPPGVIAQMQQMLGELDEDAAQQLEHYLALDEGEAVFTITDGRGPGEKPAGWQRHIAARIAQHRADLIIREESGQEPRP